MEDSSTKKREREIERERERERERALSIHISNHQEAAINTINNTYQLV
jgi:hypothetical protein